MRRAVVIELAEGDRGSGAVVAVEERDGAAAGAVADRADGGRGE